MDILKFGGTSVANAQNIKLVIAILKNKKNKLGVVVSAFSGVTDLLIQAAQKAAASDDNYKICLREIIQKHFDAISDLINKNHQEHVFDLINNL